MPIRLYALAEAHRAGDVVGRAAAAGALGVQRDDRVVQGGRARGDIQPAARAAAGDIVIGDGGVGDRRGCCRWRCRRRAGELSAMVELMTVNVPPLKIPPPWLAPLAPLVPLAEARPAGAANGRIVGNRGIFQDRRGGIVEHASALARPTATTVAEAEPTASAAAANGCVVCERGPINSERRRKDKNAAALPRPAVPTEWGWGKIRLAAILAGSAAAANGRIIIDRGPVQRERAAAVTNRPPP